MVEKWVGLGPSNKIRGSKNRSSNAVMVKTHVDRVWLKPFNILFVVVMVQSNSKLRFVVVKKINILNMKQGKQTQ